LIGRANFIGRDHSADALFLAMDANGKRRGDIIRDDRRLLKRRRRR
jgi:hypothetical protein